MNWFSGKRKYTKILTCRLDTAAPHEHRNTPGVVAQRIEEGHPMVVPGTAGLRRRCAPQRYLFRLWVFHGSAPQEAVDGDIPLLGMPGRDRPMALGDRAIFPAHRSHYDRILRLAVGRCSQDPELDNTVGAKGQPRRRLAHIADQVVVADVDTGKALTSELHAHRASESASHAMEALVLLVLATERRHRRPCGLPRAFG